MLLNLLDITRKKLKANSANFCTLVNLSFGSIAILFTLNANLNLAMLFIFIAALFDRFDGAIARKLNIESDLGKQLDSMSDIVSFGIAPALLIYQGSLTELGIAGEFFTILYIACGAFRLARFNVTENNGYFCGVPITVAGVFAAFCFLFNTWINPVIMLIIMLLLSLLMISSFKLKKM